MAAQNPFVETLSKYLDRLEIIFVIAAVGSLLALYSGVTAATTGVMISLSGLAGVYFLNAYRPPSQPQEGGEKKDFGFLLSQTVLPKILWIGCSVGAIGLLFYLLKLEGARQMLMIHAASGFFGVALFGALTLIKSSDSQAQIPVLYRVVPLTLISSYLLYGLAA